MTFVRRRDPFRERAENSGIDRDVANLLGLYLRGVPVEARATAHMQIVDLISAASKKSAPGTSR